MRELLISEYDQVSGGRTVDGILISSNGAIAGWQMEMLGKFGNDTSKWIPMSISERELFIPGHNTGDNIGGRSVIDAPIIVKGGSYPGGPF